MHTCHHSLASHRYPRTACMIINARCFGSFGHSGPSKSSDAGAMTGRRQAAAAPADAANNERRYAVVGAGLAGLATAYHLQRLSPAGTTVFIDVYDAVGIGAGGSGAAAGLLHPFTPRGKLLWKAREAMSAALELLQAAETASAAAVPEPADAAAAATVTDLCGPICWHTGMIRPAVNVKQSQDYWKAHGGSGSSNLQQQQQQGDAAAAVQQLLQATVVDNTTARQLIPGLGILTEHDASAEQKDETHMNITQQQQQQQPTVKLQAQPRQARQQQHQQQRQLDGWSPAAAAALHIPGGITLHPQRYMHALWAAAKLAAAARDDGSSVFLHIRQLKSLQDLNLTRDLASDSLQERKQLSWSAISSSRTSSSSSCGGGGSSRGYDAVVVAAGAAVGSLQEFKDQQLPLTLCQGYTLDMMIPPESNIRSPPSTNSITGTISSSGSASNSSSSSSSRSPPFTNSTTDITTSSNHSANTSSNSSSSSSSPASTNSTTGTTSSGGSASTTTTTTTTTSTSSRSPLSTNSTTVSTSSDHSASTTATTTSSSSSSSSGQSPTASAMHFGSNSPSILGSSYLASQGGDILVVGATKAYGWTAQQALEELGRKIDSTKVLGFIPGSMLGSIEQQNNNDSNNNSNNDSNNKRKKNMREGACSSGGPAVQITGKQILQYQQQQQQQCGDQKSEVSSESLDVSAAVAELLAGAAAVWPAIVDWQLKGVRSGVRAIPPRTQHGSVPLLGRWHSKQQQQEEEEEGDQDHEPYVGDDSVRVPNPHSVWLIAGLGARGLVYHAWLGELTAQAIISDSEEGISSQAPELLTWRDVMGSETATATATEMQQGADLK